MLYRFQELRRKEVISLRSGEKLGLIDDLELDADARCIRGFWLYGRRRLLGLLPGQDDLFIPADAVRLYGKDVLLCDLPEKNSSDLTNINTDTEKTL